MACDGQITATGQGLEWRGSIPPGEETTLGVAVIPLSPSVGLYAYNRASLDDGWGQIAVLEASTWIEGRLLLPVILR